MKRIDQDETTDLVKDWMSWLEDSGWVLCRESDGARIETVPGPCAEELIVLYTDALIYKIENDTEENA